MRLTCVNAPAATHSHAGATPHPEAAMSRRFRVTAVAAALCAVAQLPADVQQIKDYIAQHCDGAD